MSVDEVYDALYDWIDYVLNTVGGNSIEIIHGNDNSPKPTKPYIVMNDPPVSNVKAGSGNWPKADGTGKVDYTNQYVAAITLESVGDSGSLLQKIIDTVNRQDVKDLFKTKCIGFLRNESILNLTGLVENIFERRASIDVFISYVTEDSYVPGYIETVETPEGTYLGKK